MKDTSAAALGRPKRRFAAVAVGMVLVALMLAIGMSHWLVPALSNLVNRVANEGWYGQLAFLLLLAIVCLTGIVPASLLAIAAGTLYGFTRGTVLCALGLSVGGVAGFLAARFLFRDRAEPWISRRIALRRIDADIAQQGWRVVVLLRLSPIAPFGITSYALGLTRLRFMDYLIGTVGSLPATMAYVYMGYMTREALYLSSDAMIPWVRPAVLGLGVAATVVAGVHFYRLFSDRAR